MIQDNSADSTAAHFSSTFAGIVSFHSSNSVTCCPKGNWIVDSGATDHMTCHFSNFTSAYKLPIPRPVNLPDGSVKHVTHIGNIVLHPRITLYNTLYIPDFTCNLIFVTALTDSCTVSVNNFPDHCVVQDLQSKECIAIGLVIDGLYHLNKHSFHVHKPSTALLTCASH